MLIFAAFGQWRLSKADAKLAAWHVQGTSTDCNPLWCESSKYDFRRNADVVAEIANGICRQLIDRRIELAAASSMLVQSIQAHPADIIAIDSSAKLKLR